MSGESKILQLLLDAVAEGVFPGAVLLVSRRRNNLFFEAVGNAALVPTPRPMTRKTRFDLASRTLVSYRDHTAVDPEDLPGPTHSMATLSRRVASEGADDAVVARNARRRRRAKEHEE